MFIRRTDVSMIFWLRNLWRERERRDGGSRNWKCRSQLDLLNIWKLLSVSIRPLRQHSSGRVSNFSSPASSLAEYLISSSFLGKSKCSCAHSHSFPVTSFLSLFAKNRPLPGHQAPEAHPNLCVTFFGNAPHCCHPASDETVLVNTSQTAPETLKAKHCFRRLSSFLLSGKKKV